MRGLHQWNWMECQDQHWAIFTFKDFGQRIQPCYESCVEIILRGTRKLGVAEDRDWEFVQVQRESDRCHKRIDRKLVSPHASPSSAAIVKPTTTQPIVEIIFIEHQRRPQIGYSRRQRIALDASTQHHDSKRHDSSWISCGIILHCMPFLDSIGMEWNPGFWICGKQLRCSSEKMPKLLQSICWRSRCHRQFSSQLSCAGGGQSILMD